MCKDQCWNLRIETANGCCYNAQIRQFIGVKDAVA